ncbi:PH domain-containing protein [Paenibacillus turpanensis]|uniref:PH domain-containing protein n=1 Tax=Paenibacillus turpanensis TaxID=2689078 RepID=UPI00140A7A79|nr:PH domain-containing protein [Paenibacillus turpanensis]
MNIEIEEPTSSISSYAVNVWRITGALDHGSALAVIAILAGCAVKFQWYSWISTTLYILGAIFLVLLIISVAFLPAYRQRSWRFRIDSRYIQLKHGTWEVRHTIIPMEKVEYVKTEQGPILKRYGLYNIWVGTTTSKHVIPAISGEEAYRLKGLIAAYANVKANDSNEEETV